MIRVYLWVLNHGPHRITRYKVSPVFITLLPKPRMCILASAALNPVIQPLKWLLGSWESDEPGEGSFPSVKPFHYTEKLHFSHVGQPVINFM